MSKLVARKTRLIFETADAVRSRGKHREVIVESHPYHAVVRLKGMRGKFSITWSGIYEYAAKLYASKVRVEKLAKRKAQKGTK